MKKRFLFIYILIMFIIFPINVLAKGSLVTYSAHVSCIGWQDSVTDGEIAGTTGKALSMEAIKIKLNNLDGDVAYQTYDSINGWGAPVYNNMEAGTTGKGLPLETIKISLSGQISNIYDVYYRVHVSHIGWMGWTKNGQPAGTTGYGNNIEAIEIEVLSKSADAPGVTLNSYKERVAVNYTAHISSIGWQKTVSDGRIAGTTGKSLAIEALRMNLSNKSYSGSINYSSYVKGLGWQDAVTNGNISGTTGQSRRIEAIRISLTGEYLSKYDVYYRTHVSHIGWMGWAKNGESAGTIGYNYQIEAVEIKMVSKDLGDSLDSSNHFLEKESSIHYKSHVETYGWGDWTNGGKISGTTGQSKRMESYIIKSSNDTDNKFISYRAHVSNIGWMDWVTGGSISGTTGRALSIEAVQIKLSGYMSENYDVYYRAHVSTVGWMGWAKNGESAGTSGQGLAIEAYQVLLIKKGDDAPGDTEYHYRETKWVTDEYGNQYLYDIFGNKVTGSITISGTTRYFGPTGIYLGFNKLKVIDISAHQGNIDWNAVASSGIYGVILRIGYWNTEDSKLSRNISEIKRLGIPYGIYLFSYANTTNGAKIEADFTNNTIEKYKLAPKLGIFYDLEDWYISSDNTSNTLSKQQYDDLSRTYINAVSMYVNNSYKVKVYGDLNHINNRFGDYTRSQVDWVAQYNNVGCSYTGKYSLWQYSPEETISGIKGYVDMNYYYN